MDFFGIGTMYKTAMQLYSLNARQTGRTTALLNSLKDGDRVVFHDRKHASHFERQLLERGLKVECMVLPVDQLYRVPEKKRSIGKTIMDHAWVEEFYLQELASAIKHVDHVQELMSDAPSLPGYMTPTFKG